MEEQGGGQGLGWVGTAHWKTFSFPAQLVADPFQLLLLLPQDPNEPLDFERPASVPLPVSACLLPASPLGRVGEQEEQMKSWNQGD